MSRGPFVGFAQPGEVSDSSGFFGDDEMVKAVTLVE